MSLLVHDHDAVRRAAQLEEEASARGRRKIKRRITERPPEILGERRSRVVHLATGVGRARRRDVPLAGVRVEDAERPVDLLLYARSRPVDLRRVSLAVVEELVEGARGD